MQSQVPQGTFQLSGTAGRRTPWSWEVCRWELSSHLWTLIGFACDVLLTPASPSCCVPAQCPCTQGMPSFPVYLLMGTLFPHWETRVILPILQMGKWRLRRLSELSPYCVPGPIHQTESCIVPDPCPVNWGLTGV